MVSGKIWAVWKSITKLFIDYNEAGFHVTNQNSYTLAYCISFHRHSGAERIDLMTPFIFNLLMMENSLIKNPCWANKELWELVYEMKSVFTICIHPGLLEKQLGLL